jgi:hypothetical protein
VAAADLVGSGNRCSRVGRVDHDEFGMALRAGNSNSSRNFAVHLDRGAKGCASSVRWIGGGRQQQSMDGSLDCISLYIVIGTVLYRSLVRGKSKMSAAENKRRTNMQVCHT